MHHRHVVWAVTVLMLGAPVHGAVAQGLPVPHPTFGVMAGVNLAKVSGDGLTSADNRTGFLGGIFVTLHVTNSFAIQPEAIYSQKGFSDNSVPSADVTAKLDYIDIPVLLRYDIPVVGPIRPFFVAGPAFGLQVKCAIEASGEEASASVDCDGLQDTEVEFRKKTFDLSGMFGAGLDFHLGGHTLMLGARYEHGFSDVVEDAAVKNRTWSVVAGLGF